MSHSQLQNRLQRCSLAVMADAAELAVFAPPKASFATLPVELMR